MEPHQRMNEKIELLLEELRRINTSVLEASKKINKLDKLPKGGEDFGRAQRRIGHHPSTRGGVGGVRQ